MLTLLKDGNLKRLQGDKDFLAVIKHERSLQISFKLKLAFGAYCA